MVGYNQLNNSFEGKILNFITCWKLNEDMHMAFNINKMNSDSLGPFKLSAFEYPPHHRIWSLCNQLRLHFYGNFGLKRCIRMYTLLLRVYRQTVGFPMGSSHAPLAADSFYFDFAMRDTSSFRYSSCKHRKKKVDRQ